MVGVCLGFVLVCCFGWCFIMCFVIGQDLYGICLMIDCYGSVVLLVMRAFLILVEVCVLLMGII